VAADVDAVARVPQQLVAVLDAPVAVAVAAEAQQPATTAPTKLPWPQASSGADPRLPKTAAA
jgi:hypothetical protein